MLQKSVKSQFDLHTRLFNNVLEQIGDVHAVRRASDSVNHMVWIAGHLTHARNGMHFIKGHEKSEFYPELFDRGALLETALEYPSIREIKEKWNTISEQLSKGLENLSDVELQSEAPFKTPIYSIDSSMLGFLSFLMSHEAYHIGQLGILRKYVGEPAMHYN